MFSLVPGSGEASLFATLLHFLASDSLDELVTVQTRKKMLLVCLSLPSSLLVLGGQWKVVLRLALALGQEKSSVANR